MGKVLNKLGSKKSNAMPMSANKIEVPARVKATGYPSNRAVQIRIIKSIGIISIVYIAPLFQIMLKPVEIKK
tara:strand:- start:4 stop:219 length:216 start_codon:yes stop_codon:yes gene_type:complete